jgi:hypothetical protein
MVFENDFRLFALDSKYVFGMRWNKIPHNTSSFKQILNIIGKTRLS